MLLEQEELAAAVLGQDYQVLKLSNEIGNGFLLLQDLHGHGLILIHHSLMSLSPCFHNVCSATWLSQGLRLLTVLGQTGQQVSWIYVYQFLD